MDSCSPLQSSTPVCCTPDTGKLKSIWGYDEQIPGALKVQVSRLLCNTQWNLKVCYNVSSQIQWRNQGLPGWASCPPGRPKWGRKWRKFEQKMREPMGKWGRIEEMFLSCPPESEGLATALHRSWNLWFDGPFSELQCAHEGLSHLKSINAPCGRFWKSVPQRECKFLNAHLSYVRFLE